MHSDPFISVSDPDPYWIRIQIRSVDPDPGGQNAMVLSAGCSLLRSEGFFCSLEILYGGLGIGKL